MHRVSLLGHLVPLMRQPEPAATQALAYILKSAPGIVGEFVLLLTGERFETGRIGSEWQFENRVQPDVVIFDGHGKVRLFVENKFWAPLTRNQPVAYLRALPDSGQSVLAFIAPKDRVFSLWNELKERCRSEKLGLADELSRDGYRRIRAGERTLLLTNWRFVLESLRRVAAAGGHAGIVHDIDQLRGLTERMNSGVFLPLRGDEPTNLRVARRLLNYASLIDDIVAGLIEGRVADTSGLAAAGWGRYLNLQNRCVSLCISLRAWHRFGMTPLWCKILPEEGVPPGLVEGQFDGARGDDNGGILIPIRVSTGVERDKVVSDAVDQMRHLARLLESAPKSP